MRELIAVSVEASGLNNGDNNITVLFLMLFKFILLAIESKTGYLVSVTHLTI